MSLWYRANWGRRNIKGCFIAHSSTKLLCITRNVGVPWLDAALIHHHPHKPSTIKQLIFNIRHCVARQKLCITTLYISFQLTTERWAEIWHGSEMFPARGYCDPGDVIAVIVNGLYRIDGTCIQLLGCNAPSVPKQAGDILTCKHCDGSMLFYVGSFRLVFRNIMYFLSLKCSNAIRWRVSFWYMFLCSLFFAQKAENTPKTTDEPHKKLHVPH